MNYPSDEQLISLPGWAREHLFDLKRQIRDAEQTAVEDGLVYDPVTRHPYITTLGGQNIGPPGVFEPRQVQLKDITRRSP